MKNKEKSNLAKGKSDSKTKNVNLKNQKSTKENSKPLANTKENSEKSKIEQIPDSYNVLLFPISTEKVISNIETLNQLVFAVKLNSTKKQIKEEFERLFKVKVKKVNTKISPKGIKYAYIRLKEGKADDIAMQLKMI